MVTDGDREMQESHGLAVGRHDGSAIAWADPTLRRDKDREGSVGGFTDPADRVDVRIDLAIRGTAGGSSGARVTIRMSWLTPGAFSIRARMTRASADEPRPVPTISFPS
jgi:hypothetical protein